ncbi:hypothetical protein J4218_06915 [Candidatus Pacearchaeota archaeon]|nr:hypothetical protein [Candidatus Pacearchaeota archaeon]
MATYYRLKSEQPNEEYKPSRIERMADGAIIGGLCGGFLGRLFVPKQPTNTQEEVEISRRTFLKYITTCTISGAAAGATANYPEPKKE